VSGGQPAVGCGHPGDDETILNSRSNCPCAASSGALEIALRHRETGTGPEGNFGSLEEEVDRPEGNFRPTGGGLGHVKEQRLTGVLATQGNLSCKAKAGRSSPECRATCVRAAKATAASGTRGNLGCAGAKTGALGEVSRGTAAGFEGAGARAIGCRARRDRARPLHLMHGGASSYVQCCKEISAARKSVLQRNQCCNEISDVRRPRCGSGCAACAPGTASCGPARPPPRRPPRSHRSRPSRAPRRSATSPVAASSASGRRC
jgi:hypothetical protein